MPQIALHTAADEPQPDDNAGFRLGPFLPYRLNVAAGLASLALSRIYGERYKIGVPEWRVLTTLGQFDLMTAKAIGTYTYMHKTKVSRAVAAMERRGWLARKSNDADLRESLLSLTPAGHAVIKELAPLAAEFERDLLNAVEPGDRPALDRALTQLAKRSADLVNRRSRR